MKNIGAGIGITIGLAWLVWGWLVPLGQWVWAFISHPVEVLNYLLGQWISEALGIAFLVGIAAVWWIASKSINMWRTRKPQ